MQEGSAVCVSTHVCVPVCGGHMFISGVFHSHSPHYPLRQGLSWNRVHQEATLANQWARGIFLSPLHQQQFTTLVFLCQCRVFGLVLCTPPTEPCADPQGCALIYCFARFPIIGVENKAININFIVYHPQNSS